MGLSKVSSHDYLDAVNLSYAGKLTKRAYLVATNTGTAKTQQGFITFYLKDINGYVITARLFGVKDFLEQGYTLASMKKGPVSVSFIAQVFNGSPSLVVSEIIRWEGDFDYNLFLGKVDRAEDILSECNSLIANKAEMSTLTAFRPGLATESYLGFCNGMSGGYVKFAEMTLNSIFGSEGTPGVNVSDLAKVTAVCLSGYPKYLELVEKLDVPMKHELLNIIYSHVQKVSDERIKNICVDCLSALMNIGDATHLYSHIIHSSVRNVEKILRLSYAYPLIMEGSIKKVGDDISLAKY